MKTFALVMQVISAVVMMVQGIRHYHDKPFWKALPWYLAGLCWWGIGKLFT